MYRESYGWPEIIGSIVTLTVMLGLLISLDGMAWAWALGKGVVAGLKVGIIIGGAVGLLFGLLGSLQTTRMGRRSMGAGLGAILGGPLLLIGIIGLVVGALRQTQ